MKKLICIVCPKGCHLQIDEETLAVSGNSCQRGEHYAKDELTNPMRILTGTVNINGGIRFRLPVRTETAIPREKLFEGMKILHSVTVSSPVKRGDIIIKDLAGTGVNVIASRDM